MADAVQVVQQMGSLAGSASGSAVTIPFTDDTINGANGTSFLRVGLNIQYTTDVNAAGSSIQVAIQYSANAGSSYTTCVESPLTVTASASGAPVSGFVDIYRGMLTKNVGPYDHLKLTVTNEDTAYTALYALTTQKFN